MARGRPPTERLTLLAAAVDGAPVCVFVADSDMRYVAVNEYACDLLGYEQDELLTMRVTDVATYSEAPSEYRSMMATAYLTGSSRIRCKDGEEVTLSYVAGEVEIDGGRFYVSVGVPQFPPPR